MAGPWDVVGEAPLAPASGAPAADPWAVVAEAPTAPVTPGPVSSVFISPDSIPTPTAMPSVADRFRVNARDAFDSTLAGEVINRVQSGQVAQTTADDMQRSIEEARARGSTVALDSFSDGRPNPYAQMPLDQIEGMRAPTAAEADKRAGHFMLKRGVEQHEMNSMPSFTQADGVLNKVAQGIVALGGQLVGGAASPENLIGGPGKGIVREAGENVIKYGARRAAPGAAEGAAGAAAANPVVQQGRTERGEQDGFSGAELGESVVLGGGVGAGFRLIGPMAKGVVDFVARRRGVTPDKVDPTTVGPSEYELALQDPQVLEIAKANGIDVSGADPRVLQIRDKMEARRTEEAYRPGDGPDTSLTAQEKEIARRQKEAAGVERGDIDPAATNHQPRPVNDTTIRVDSEGGAFRADDGALAGRDKSGILQNADQKALPAPGRAVLTDEEIARTRSASEGGQRPIVETPELFGGDGRAPQTRADIDTQRQAGEAFDLAQRQEDRSGSAVRDTQTAGRPRGIDNNEQVMVDPATKHAVRFKRFSGEKVIVEPYDPRTGKAIDGVPEYEVEQRALREKSYAKNPRSAQDFVERAEGPRPPEQPRGPRESIVRQPRQTYRAGEEPRPETDTGPLPETVPPSAKPDTSPPARPNGPAGAAPRSAAGDAPAAATVRREPSFDDQVRVERERVWEDKTVMGGSKRGGAAGGRARMNEDFATDVARERVVRREAADVIRRAADNEGLDDAQVPEIAKHYRRADGETPDTAWNRAVDRWHDANEREALTWDGMGDDVRNHDYLASEGNRDPVMERAYGLLEEHYTGRAKGHVDEDIPFGSERGEGAPGNDAGTQAAADARQRPEGEGARGQTRGRGEDAREPATDAGPDGGRQTVIPGAERDVRGANQRRADAPLKGGNEAPPKGGLFDEDTRKQGDIFDVPKKGDDFTPGSTFHSNPLFDPKVWKWFGRSLGFNEKWRSEVSALAKDIADSRINRGEKTGKLGDIGRLMFYSTDGALRAVGKAYGDSPTIKEIADMLFAPADAGRGGAVGRTFTEAVSARANRNINELARIVGPFSGNKSVVDQIVRLVQNPHRINEGTPVHDAAAGLRKLLEDEHKYLKAAGVDVGYQKGYFPRELDVTKVIANPAGFKSAAVRAYRAAGLPAKEAEEAADQWFGRVALGNVNVRADGTDFVSLSGAPTRDFAKGRTLTKAADEILKAFYHTDPLEMLTVHFQRTSRRAEWAERFGDDLKKWKELKERLIDEGNAAAIPEVVRAIASSTGATPAVLPNSAQAVVGFLRTYGVIRLLPRATITSLSETLLPTIRSGQGPASALSNIVKTTRALYKRSGEIGETRDFAEDLGLIMRGTEMGLLAARFNALDPTNRAHERVLNRFFRATGLEQFTAATRVTAVSSAETFIRRLALDIADGKSRKASARSLLTEMGIKDVDGFSKWVAANRDAKLGRDFDATSGNETVYRDAVVRFVNQAIMSPSASTRPRWANHPLGSLVFMLQSYAYAFHKNVLIRSKDLAVQAATGDGYGVTDRARMLAPIAMLPALVAVQMGVAPLRQAVFGTAGKETKSEDEENTQLVMQAISRSGLTGAWDSVFNLFTGAKYHRDAATSALGPVVGGTLTSSLDVAMGLAPQELGGSNSAKTNTAERNAARALYEMIVAPAAVFGASMLPGGVGAIAAQVPGLNPVREGFREAVAGPPQKTGGKGRSRQQRASR